MSIYAGVDCGTQSTKVVFIDTKSEQILGQGQAQHPIMSNSNGKREQEPKWWIEAFISAFHSAINNTKILPTEIRGIAISGQQHGLVALDKDGNVLIPTKLWCDTETYRENNEIIEALGGNDNALSELGINITTGYTASKILWFKKHNPKLWQRLDTILLPHDYLNFWLTGQKVMEYGDASGTGLFDVYQRTWNNNVIQAIDTSGQLHQALPKLVTYDDIIGNVLPHIAEQLGISSKTVVSVGGGDNMMSAIGTGNVQQGIITMSLGTSGTLFGSTQKPLFPPSNLIANFCSSTNGWLPLVCTMNITAATSLIQRLFQYDLTEFNNLLSSSSIGAEGITVLPFFNGERTPNLPNATATITGLNANNFTQTNLIRAVLEGATFSLRYGLDQFHQANINTTQIRLTGGGAKNAIWRQIIADIMNCPIICLHYSESAALGAAIQVAWAQLINEKSINENEKQNLLIQICEKFVCLDENSLTYPNPKNVRQYQAIYEHYLLLLNQYYLEKENAIKN